MSVNVLVRSRPLSDCGRTEHFKFEDNVISQLKTQAQFTVDYTYDGNSSTSELQQKWIDPIVDSALEGFHGTVFAYGQTGSGKTFTMTGNANQPGIIPLSVERIFLHLEESDDSNKQYLLRVAYFEIYCEKISDLLSNGASSRHNLEVREDQKREPYVHGLQELDVACKEDVMSAFEFGNSKRKTGATAMNSESSRSHAIFRITIESKDPCGIMTMSHLNLVDLAGSEKLSQTKAEGQRMKEGIEINLSLSQLNMVIKQITQGDAHISYRNSKLTRILQNAIGGNSKTCIICTISPWDLDETVSTLRFATNAKRVKNEAKKNEIIPEVDMIRIYKARIAQLENQKSEALKRIAEDAEADAEVKSLVKQIENIKKFSSFETSKSDHTKTVYEAFVDRRKTWAPGNTAAGSPGFSDALAAIVHEKKEQKQSNLFQDVKVSESEASPSRDDNGAAEKSTQVEVGAMGHDKSNQSDDQCSESMNCNLTWELSQLEDKLTNNRTTDVSKSKKKKKVLFDDNVLYDDWGNCLNATNDDVGVRHSPDYSNPVSCTNEASTGLSTPEQQKPIEGQANQSDVVKKKRRSKLDDVVTRYSTMDESMVCNTPPVVSTPSADRFSTPNLFRKSCRISEKLSKQLQLEDSFGDENLDLSLAGFEIMENFLELRAPGTKLEKVSKSCASQSLHLDSEIEKFLDRSGSQSIEFSDMKNIKSFCESQLVYLNVQHDKAPSSESQILDLGSELEKNPSSRESLLVDLGSEPEKAPSSRESPLVDLGLELEQAPSSESPLVDLGSELEQAPSTRESQLVDLDSELERVPISRESPLVDLDPELERAQSNRESLLVDLNLQHDKAKNSESRLAESQILDLDSELEKAPSTRESPLVDLDSEELERAQSSRESLLVDLNLQHDKAPSIESRLAESQILDLRSELEKFPSSRESLLAYLDSELEKATNSGESLLVDLDSELEKVPNSRETPLVDLDSELEKVPNSRETPLVDLDSVECNVNDLSANEEETDNELVELLEEEVESLKFEEEEIQRLYQERLMAFQEHESEEMAQLNEMLEYAEKMEELSKVEYNKRNSTAKEAELELRKNRLEKELLEDELAIIAAENAELLTELECREVLNKEVLPEMKKERQQKESEVKKAEDELNGLDLKCNEMQNKVKELENSNNELLDQIKFLEKCLESYTEPPRNSEETLAKFARIHDELVEELGDINDEIDDYKKQRSERQKEEECLNRNLEQLHARFPQFSSGEETSPEMTYEDRKKLCNERAKHYIRKKKECGEIQKQLEQQKEEIEKLHAECQSKCVSYFMTKMFGPNPSTVLDPVGSELEDDENKENQLTSSSDAVLGDDATSK